MKPSHKHLVVEKRPCRRVVRNIFECLAAEVHRFTKRILFYNNKNKHNGYVGSCYISIIFLTKIDQKISYYQLKHFILVKTSTGLNGWLPFTSNSVRRYKGKPKIPSLKGFDSFECFTSPPYIYFG